MFLRMVGEYGPWSYMCGFFVFWFFLFLFFFQHCDVCSLFIVELARKHTEMSQFHLLCIHCRLR